MARLGDGTQGMVRSIAIATLAPGGTIMVPAALVMDEVEHQRAGIGCMLESTGNGELHVSVVVPGGAAHASGLQEGDLIEGIDGHRLRPGKGGVEQLSSLIRGPSGSYVEVCTCKGWRGMSTK
jgi:C-terminal processing protease CtpA/Prc